MDDDLLDDFEFEDDEPLFDDYVEEGEEIEFEEAESTPATQNRAFLIGVAVLAGLFVIALCAVLLIILTRPTTDPITLTNTAIMQLLATTQAVDTQQAIERLTQEAFATETQAALNALGTEQALALTSQALTATAEASAAAASQTAVAIAQLTADAAVITDTPPVEVTPVTVTPIGSPVTDTPTPEGLPGAVTPAPPSGLPDTGIADDLGVGSTLFIAGAAAMGLLAVMFVARRLRTSNYDEEQS